MKFSDLPLRSELQRAILAIGYEKPSEIQERAIPLILEGVDLVGQSQTGTGKTAAFMLPILEKAMANPSRKPQTLILCPTRELAIQVASEARKFAQYMESVRIVAIYGGESIEKQIKDLKRGADIIVGTPGRVMDHIRRRTLKFDETKMLVLDEADEMLNMGFYDDIIEVLGYLPEERQTILFSATMAKPILALTKTIQNDPQIIKIKTTSLTVSTIRQVAYEVNPNSKAALLVQLLQLYAPTSTIIFSNTKKMVDELATELNNANYSSAALHGDMKQEMRSAVMDRFKDKKISVLIATDVAARGIDVDNVDLVVNYDIPQELEYYVHRIGRTGRAGKAGLAMTLYTPRQRRSLQQIETIAKCTIERLPLPSKDDLQGIMIDQLSVLIQRWKDKQTKYTQEALEKLELLGYTSDDVLSALLNKHIANNSFRPIDHPTRDVREPRGEGKDSRRSRSNEHFSKIVLSVGEKQGISTAHVVSAIAESCNISGREIGKIKIEQRSTIVEIPEGKEKEILAALANTTIKGKPIFVTAIRKENKPSDKYKPKKDGRKEKARRPRN